MGDDDVTPETLLAAAERLARAVDALETAVGIAATLEHRTTGTEKIVRRQRRINRLLAVSVVLDVVLSASLIVLGVTQAQSQNDLCHATRRSWDTRNSLVLTLTKPTVLSPEAERLFPASQIASLRVQIDASNRSRAIQRKELLAENGARPNC